jgi:hypothetical protein
MATNFPREKRLELMRRAWSLAVDGRAQASIAAELGISTSQVCRYLRKMRDAAWTGVVEEVLTYQVLSLRQTDRLLDEALRGLERSTRPRKKATRKVGAAGAAGKGDGPEPQTTTEAVEGPGDPAWLAEARASIRLRLDQLDRLMPRDDPKQADEAGAATVAGALLEAERRDEAYPTPPAPEPAP